MAPMDITVGQLIDRIERDLPAADPVARVSEARRRAKILGDVGDALIDHFVQAARRAGASWSQIGDAMGVSKQAAQQRAAGGSGRFARFTERARRVVANAQALARDQRHGHVEPAHVLIALLEATDALAAKIVEAHGADPGALAERVRATLPPAGTGDAVDHVPFSAASKEALERTAQNAVDLLNNYIGTEHILLGILAVPDNAAARTLVEAGVDYKRARDMVAAALTGFQHGAGKLSDD
jgi:molybdenum-dependent DNA-binding transcriptional regulator ModE